MTVRVAAAIVLLLPAAGLARLLLRPFDRRSR